jgi:hypothetical protein
VRVQAGYKISFSVLVAFNGIVPDGGPSGKTFFDYVVSGSESFPQHTGPSLVPSKPFTIDRIGSPRIGVAVA